jgi:hypothetical protein
MHKLTRSFVFSSFVKQNTCKSRQAHDGRRPSAIQNSTTCHAKHKRNFKHAIFVDVDTLLLANIAPAQKCIAIAAIAAIAAAAAALCDTYGCQRWFWGRSPNDPHAFSPYDAMKHVPKGSRAMQSECRRCEVPKAKAPALQVVNRNA